MDYLPIQASAVPCERVFSSSAETDTKKRNRLSPLTMEALQMLKFYLKKERLHFMRGWVTSKKQMAINESEEVEGDPLEALLRGDFQNNLDKIIRSIDQDDDNDDDDDDDGDDDDDDDDDGSDDSDDSEEGDQDDQDE